MKKPLGHPEYVYIKQSGTLAIENYVPTNGKFTGGMIKKDYFYWKAYDGYKQRFLDLHRKLADELVNNKYCPVLLWDEYTEARTDFLTAHEILNLDFENSMSNQ